MKEKIIQHASELFLTLGFKSVTMDDIAREIGISKKTIYKYFSNKTKLVKATTLFTFNEINLGINQICALKKNPIEELFDIKEFVMNLLKDEASSPVFQLKKYYPEVYNSLQIKQIEVMQDCVKENLSRGMELGLYLEDLDVEFISRIYFSGITSIKDDQLFPVMLFPKKHLITKYLIYHLRAITTPKGLKYVEQFIKTENS